MADNFTAANTAGSNCFKEAVCVNVGRIYDSCSDKDCIDSLRVYFTDVGQEIINTSSSVKCKNVQVLDVFMDVEPVPFNKGFYSVDMTFYFGVSVETVNPPCLTPVITMGLAVFTKKVILYGSEGKVNIFTSDACGSGYPNDGTPKASVQVVSPICLACKLCECTPCNCSLTIPSSIAEKFDGSFENVTANRFVEVSLGVFSIVSLERMVQMMIPVYDFSIPDKECVQTTNDDPCELFKRIKFPVNEFFPPRLADLHQQDDCD